jgi:hypothetical protein
MIGWKERKEDPSAEDGEAPTGGRRSATSPTLSWILKIFQNPNVFEISLQFPRELEVVMCF